MVSTVALQQGSPQFDSTPGAFLCRGEVGDNLINILFINKKIRRNFVFESNVRPEVSQHID